MRAAFKKFGTNLACPQTGVQVLDPEFMTDDQYLKKYNKDLLTRTIGAQPVPSALKQLTGAGLSNKRPNLHLRSFSTKVSTNQNTDIILPYFITGFVDAEGSFRLKISKNSQYKIG
jgi:hypothetical protein